MKQRVLWNDLSLFLAVARHGGLSASARDVGSSPATMGRRMLALERSLGRELFVRHTHGYELTEGGRRLAAELRGAEARILRATSGGDTEALPVVKITAGSWTTLSLVPRLDALRGTPPDLRLRVLPDEEFLSLSRREAAIGLRARLPTEAGLAGRRLRRVAFAPYARDEVTTAWIVVRAETPSARWVGQRAGADVAVETTSPALALDMARAGHGRLLLPTFLGDGEPTLDRVGSEVEELAHEQWLVTHDEDRRLPEVRRALDRMVDALAE